VGVVDTVVVAEEEDEDGGDKDMDIDIDHHQDLYGIVHGTGLEGHANEDVQVLEMVNGVVNIQVQDQMIVGLLTIVMGVAIKIFLYNINGL
jgi:hypothetical protein